MNSQQPQPSINSIGSLLSSKPLTGEHMGLNSQQLSYYPNQSSVQTRSLTSGTPFVGALNLGSSGAHASVGSVSALIGRTPYTPATPATPLHDKDAGIPRPQLQNIVCTVYLGCRLDLKKIALHARNAEYNPKRFAAVIMRIREPRTTALIFSSGKMVCTGAKSELQAKLAARKYARIIQKLGFEVSHFLIIRRSIRHFIIVLQRHIVHIVF
ncbi:unnamed protein product [Protopolystoma xenopodis]|uniref:TATA-box-binding protein n=1 Tax=Protopolystoma xenopodis TaxID=117903 RepID=A0A3S5A3C9_9PLAT|nr:unnamed protein product [Protopolystoma xenopodis]